MKKVLYFGLAVLVVCFGSWTYKLVFGKPLKLNHFAERIFIQEALKSPEMLTHLGLIDNTVLDFHSDRLDDLALDDYENRLQHIQNNLNTLHSYNFDNLSEQEKLTYLTLEDYANKSLEFSKFNLGKSLEAFRLYPVNQLFGTQSSLPEFMATQHQVKNIKSANNYIKRLCHFSTKFDQLIELLEQKQSAGVVLPSFILENVISEVRTFFSKPIEENILYTAFSKKVASLSRLSDQRKQALLEKAKDAIQTHVYPSYEKLYNFLNEQKALSNRDAGIWKIPNGNKLYQYYLKVHTTTDYTPKQVHEIGLKEVSRIQDEMQKQLADLGYTEKTPVEHLQDLSKDPKFLYEDSKAGREQLLNDFKSIFDRIEDKLPNLFVALPNKKLSVMQVPQFKEKTAPPAYYQRPALDGSKPGIFFINTCDMNSLPKFTIETLAFHEGIPGHHFQISKALELKTLPTFRKIVPYTAYLEGWALYSEQLAYEEGFLSNPYSNLGRLQFELLRAARLVVDTGIHYKKWTREQAIDYFIETTGLTKYTATTEVDRYIVFPGQACSYKIGMIKILELRELEKKALGKDFDIRKFHDKVLKNGAVPLSVLEKEIKKDLPS